MRISLTSSSKLALVRVVVSTGVMVFFLYGRASLGWAGEGTHPYVVVSIASGGFRHPRRIRMSSSWFLPCVPFLDERCGNRAAKYRRRRRRGSPSSARHGDRKSTRLNSSHV